MSWIWIFGLFLVFCVLTSVCLPLESIDNVTDRKDKINLDIDETSLDENSAARKEYLKTLQKKLAFAVYHGDKARVSEVENEVSPEKRIKSSSTTKRNTKAKATETTSDWSERDKRNLETHDQNDIFTHSTEKSGAAHTTESHIEVLLKHPPAEKEEGSNGGGSDSGGFLGGLLSSVVAGASAASSGGGSEDGGGSAGFFSKLVQFKLALLRSIFSIVTGLLSSSSSSSSSASG